LQTLVTGQLTKLPIRLILFRIFACLFYCRVHLFKPMICLSLGPHLFVKVPRPGDSEVSFRSSSQAAICYYQSNHSMVEAIPLLTVPCPRTQQPNLRVYLHTNPFLLSVKQVSCEYQLLNILV